MSHANLRAPNIRAPSTPRSGHPRPLARSLITLALAIVCALPGSSAAHPARQESLQADLLEDLEPLPRPDLSGEESPVREQLVASRTTLERKLAERGTRREELAAAFGRLGGLYYLYELDDLVAPALRNAIRLEPQNWLWKYYLAVHQGVVGESDQAETLLREVAELRPDYVPAQLRLADLRLGRGALGEAEAAYRAVLELEPDSVDSADVDSAGVDSAGVESAGLDPHRLDSERAAAWAGLGQVAAEREQYQRAVELLSMALELQPEANALYHQLGMSYRALGDRERAVDSLRKNRHVQVRYEDPALDSLAAESRSPKAIYAAAREAVERDDLEPAIALFRAHLENGPDDPAAHHDLGRALLRNGQTDEGLHELRRAVELAPANRQFHYHLGAVLVDQGELAAGLEHYRRAHEIDPHEPYIHVDYAVLLARLGRPEEALEELGRLLERDPQQEHARLQYAIVLASLGRYAEAAPRLERAAASGGLAPPHRAEALYHLGLMNQERGEAAAAERRLREAIALDPRSPDAHGALAQLLGAGGRFIEAAEHFDAVLELDEGRDRAHLGRALALMLGERYGEALAALEESAGARPGHPPLTHALARLLATCPDPAVRDGERALRLARQVLDAQRTLEHAETVAMALAEVGRFEEAAVLQQQVLEQARRITPQEHQDQTRRERRLESYRRGEPVRAPWLRGGP